MALTASILLDVPGSSQTLTFFLGNSQIEQIVFSDSHVTYGSIGAFNLSKSDLAIYYDAYNSLSNSMIQNFPSVIQSKSVPLPHSDFEMRVFAHAIGKIENLQKSGGNLVYGINYNIFSKVADFEARPSPVETTLQEFFTSVSQGYQFSKQVALN